jgi:hypothetical protein
MGWGLNVGSFPSFLGMSGIATINNTGLVMNVPVPPKLEELLMNSTISAVGLTNATTERTVQIQRWNAFYSYSQPSKLLASYGTAMGVALVSIVLGMIGWRRNGVSADRGFFQIVSTTRNPEFDALCEGHWLGGNENMPGGFKETLLRFGSARDGSRSFFGTDGAITG